VEGALERLEKASRSGVEAKLKTPDAGAIELEHALAFANISDIERARGDAARAAEARDNAAKALGLALAGGELGEDRQRRADAIKTWLGEAATSAAK
jgi:hypothetical protein